MEWLRNRDIAYSLVCLNGLAAPFGVIGRARLLHVWTQRTGTRLEAVGALPCLRSRGVVYLVDQSPDREMRGICG